MYERTSKKISIILLCMSMGCLPSPSDLEYRRDGDPTDDMGTPDASRCQPDCGSETVCDAETGQCVPCLGDDDCPAGVCVIDPLDATMNVCVACISADDCPVFDNATVSCVDNECSYTCDMGFTDAPETTDRCTCEIGEEVCNGADDDCDGMLDEELDFISCRGGPEPLAGVCAGASVGCADGTRAAYRIAAMDGVCTETAFTAYAATKGDFYTGAEDEMWRCDGADNDCDDMTDEACCQMATPTPSTYGTSRGNGQAHPAITEAASGAPARAAHLLVWAEGGQIYMQHIDEAGVGRGSEKSFKTGAILDSIDVETTANGYLIAFINNSDTNTLKIKRFDTSGVPQDGEDLVSSSSDVIDHVALSTNGTQVLVAWSQGVTNAQELKACVFDPSAATNPCTSASNHRVLTEDLKVQAIPAVDVNSNGDFALAWFEYGTPSKIQSTTLGEGNMDNRVIGIELGSGDEVSQRVTVAWQDDATYHVVGPDFSGSAKLVHVPVTSGSAGNATDLTGANGSVEPAALGVDTDLTPGVDSLVLVYKEGSELFSAAVDLSNIGMVTGSKIVDVQDQRSYIDLSAGERGVGLTWLDTDDAATVQYVPLSLDGPPICAPSAAP